MAIIKILRDYCGEEGTDVDKNVFAGSEHTVSRARAASLHAVGLALILHDEAEPAEAVIQAEPVITPPQPQGEAQAPIVTPLEPVPAAEQDVARVETAETIAAPIEPLKEEPVAEEKQDKPLTNKAAPEPRNKSAPRARAKASVAETPKAN